MTPARGLYELLLEARTTGRLIADIPPTARPSDLRAAYEVARRLAEGRGKIAGWKVGATSARGQRMLGLAEPFFGRLFADDVLADPASITADEETYAIEPEIAFMITRDMPARAIPYTLAEVAEAIDAIAPALELNRPSFVQPFAAGGLALIADNGVNVGACLGAWRRGWRGLDLRALTTEITRDDEPPVSGTAGAVLGNPLIAVAWLANALPLQGCVLSAGQTVLSGAMTPPLELGAGQRVRARFAGLGAVGLHVAPRGLR